METALKKMRLIQWALLLATGLFALATELLLENRGSSDWNWRHWLLVGYSTYAVLVAMRFRRRLFNRATAKLRNGEGDASVAKPWQAGNLISFLMAWNVGLCGLVIRFVLHGALWQASVFYGAAIFLLLLWTACLPTGNISA